MDIQPTPTPELRVERWEASQKADAARADAERIERMERVAPELYAALKSIMDTMPSSQDRGCLSIGQWHAARAALAKAEGR